MSQNKILILGKKDDAKRDELDDAYEENSWCVPGDEGEDQPVDDESLNDDAMLLVASANKNAQSKANGKIVVDLTPEQELSLKNNITAVRRRERAAGSAQKLGVNWKSLAAYMVSKDFVEDIGGEVFDLEKLTIARKDPENPIDLDDNCILITKKRCQKLGSQRAKKRKKSDSGEPPKKKKKKKDEAAPDPREFQNAGFIEFEAKVRAVCDACGKCGKEPCALHVGMLRMCPCCDRQFMPLQGCNYCYRVEGMPPLHYPGELVCGSCYNTEHKCCGLHAENLTQCCVCKEWTDTSKSSHFDFFHVCGTCMQKKLSELKPHDREDLEEGEVAVGDCD